MSHNNVKEKKANWVEDPDKKRKRAPRRARRYMFDQHYFDETGIGEEKTAQAEEMPSEPEPVIYSEEQYERAVQESYSQGYEEGQKAGEKQTLESIEQQATQVLDRLMQKLEVLEGQEAQRFEYFEQETAMLVHKIFQKLLPHYKQTQAFEEINHFIEKIVQSHNQKSPLKIFVYPDLVEHLESGIKNHKNLKDYNIKIEGDETLDISDCKVFWAHGGAIREMSALEREIESIFEQHLAQSPQKAHNVQSVQTQHENVSETQRPHESENNKPGKLEKKSEDKNKNQNEDTEDKGLISGSQTEDGQENNLDQETEKKDEGDING